MTIQLQQQRGSVTLYGSFDIQNPNSAFHSFRIESSGNVFVPLGDSGQSPTTDEGLSKRLVKRIISQLSNRTLYVSIEGQQDLSSFILETTFGDTCKLLSYFILISIPFKTCELHIHAAGAPTHLMSVGLFLSFLTLIFMLLC